MVASSSAIVAGSSVSAGLVMPCAAVMVAPVTTAPETIGRQVASLAAAVDGSSDAMAARISVDVVCAWLQIGVVSASGDTADACKVSVTAFATPGHRCASGGVPALQV